MPFEYETVFPFAVHLRTFFISVPLLENSESIFAAHSSDFIFARAEAVLSSWFDFCAFIVKIIIPKHSISALRAIIASIEFIPLHRADVLRVTNWNPKFYFYFVSKVCCYGVCF